ncbi:DUF4198 domain-containing protein [Marinimicrobium alkaliphilum]|uniref:DUF4198 domain-containing protein n=1 Tax=Marinimicrobium alkaliphilum TaxID=2202654 RepID=UPI000DB97313|nr:DUF4198 domain-containing protein [Marinimicrobium alkaliphilum]
MTLKKSIPLFLVVAFMGALATTAHAHRAWIQPGATVHSAEDAWVTFDAAISNDIFYTDYHAMRGNFQVIAPGGETVDVQNLHTGRFRTTFDLNLTATGTYRIANASNGLRARWEENGERRGYPGRGQAYTPEGYAQAVPENAANLEVTQFSRRIETFVTAGAPTKETLKPSGEGIELLAITHPNDLFAGEAAQFQILIDGEPAVGASVTVIPDAMRYRNAQDAIELTTDAQGKVTIDWPRAGMYYFNASYRDEQAKAPATVRTGDYTAVFEVLPL